MPLVLKNKIRWQQDNNEYGHPKTHLKLGRGDACAGHVSLSGLPSLWVSLVRSVSDGNFGADPPTGSEL